VVITLNHFARFVDSKGAAKTQVVREAIRLPKYQVPIDHWHGLRSGIVRIIQNGGTRTDLDRLLADVKDDRKRSNYEANIEGFKKFWGRKTLKFQGVPNARRWSSGELEVKVAPDFSVLIGKQLYIVKLHFRGGPVDDRLSRTRLETIICLMKKVCPTKGAEFAVLDVRLGQLRTRKVSIGFGIALVGEAAAFIEIMRDLEAQESAS
jgi:hypothetical protein